MLLRGKIYTSFRAGPQRTEALWVRDGQVAAVGPQALEQGARDPVTDLEPHQCAMPGFWDAHLHLVDYGVSLHELRLEGLTSAEEVRRTLAEAASRHTSADRTPIVGRGWMVGTWQGEPPHRRHLDAVVPDRPVFLWNHDHHSLWVNSRVLQLAGIDRSTPDPEGGAFERDAAGEPTGVIRDAALSRVTPLLPPLTAERAEEAIGRAQEALWRLGVTGVCTMGESAVAARALVSLHRRRALGLRVALYQPVRVLPELEAAGIAAGLGDDRLWLGGLKGFMDGALGSQTAWMEAPYGGSTSVGLPRPFAREVGAARQRAEAAGLRLAVHAIGDRAVAEAVRALGSGLPPPIGPHRVEHAQLVPQAVMMRWPGHLVASMQPIHLTDDLELMARFWGARSRWAFPFASLLRHGVPLVFGSDAPVSDPDPLRGLWAAVERRRSPKEPPFEPEERLTPEQALAAYTQVPAVVEGRPHLGQLLPGSPADLVVLSRDPLDPQVEWEDLRVVATWVDGIPR